jgi:hypothetical protein
MAYRPTSRCRLARRLASGLLCAAMHVLAEAPDDGASLGAVDGEGSVDGVGLLEGSG